MDIIKFMGILSLTWLFAEGAYSIKFIKNFIGIGPDSTPINIWAQVARSLVNCSMCSGFWIGLIYYQDFVLACLVSLSAEIFSRLIRFLFVKI